MKLALCLAALTAFALPVSAEDLKSLYTQIDLKKCRQTAKPDQQVFEGAWTCKGIAGYDVFLTAADAREMVSFGKSEKDNCAATKTFGGFNSAGKTIEWRMKNGRPIAAILRWTVSVDPEDSTKTATWLVVSKLENGTSCPMHYVAGSAPKANEAARKAADAAEAFDCAKAKPGFEPADKPPNVSLEACSAQAQ